MKYFDLVLQIILGFTCGIGIATLGLWFICSGAIWQIRNFLKKIFKKD